ncbi:MAG TPA: DUF3866 family protein [Solirubrobacteraceae bacterium]
MSAQQRLVLRRGTVTAAEAVAGPEQQVRVDDHPAVADVAMVGTCEVGDDVVVNEQAVRLGLGSGGLDIVHVNLTRGLGGGGVEGAHVMKLNYTSLQHAVLPEDGEAASGPVGVFSLHGQLAPMCWAIAQARPGTRVGYVQTAGGALPGGHSHVVRELHNRGLLHLHVTAGPCYGAVEAITTIGGIARAAQDCDVVLCGPGPGILGSSSRLGHGGMVALDSAHAALALGCDVVLCARMSESDPRERHQGVSHHTQTVLDLLLKPVTCVTDPADPTAYLESGLPTRNMGREDPVFFGAAIAAGLALV